MQKKIIYNPRFAQRISRYKVTTLNISHKNARFRCWRIFLAMNHCRCWQVFCFQEVYASDEILCGNIVIHLEFEINDLPKIIDFSAHNRTKRKRNELSCCIIAIVFLINNKHLTLEFRTKKSISKDRIIIKWIQKLTPLEILS